MGWQTSFQNLTNYSEKVRDFNNIEFFLKRCVPFCIKVEKVLQVRSTISLLDFKKTTEKLLFVCTVISVVCFGIESRLYSTSILFHILSP